MLESVPSEDIRLTDARFIHGLAAIRRAFKDCPECKPYIDALVARIIEAYGRIQAEENQLAISA